jgi:hypothetical protein
VVGTASPAEHDLLTRLGATPVAYGDGVADRIRAAAPDGIDGVMDLVGRWALRVVAGLVPAGRLYSVADKPLVKELGGNEVAREPSTSRWTGPGRHPRHPPTGRASSPWTTRLGRVQSTPRSTCMMKTGPGGTPGPRLPSPMDRPPA